MHRFAHRPAAPGASLLVGDLGPVASTLLILLTARSYSDVLLPQVAISDTMAARTLAALGVDASAAAATYLNRSGQCP